jgi:hypothetical protein
VKGAGVEAKNVSAKLVISGSGQVVSAAAPAAGPAEGCVAQAIRGLTFPKFRGENMAVSYTYMVQ